MFFAFCVVLFFVCRTRFAFSEVPTNDGDKGEYGDILLQVMDAEDAEYGGPLEDVSFFFPLHSNLSMGVSVVIQYVV